jgi:hypothetical protein
LTGDTCGDVYANCYLAEFHRDSKECFNIECKTTDAVDKVAFYNDAGEAIAWEQNAPYWYGMNDEKGPLCLDKCPSEVAKAVGYDRDGNCLFREFIDVCEPDEPKEPKDPKDSKKDSKKKDSKKKDSKKKDSTKKDSKKKDSKKDSKKSY